MTRRRSRRNEERRQAIFLFLFKVCVVVGIFALLTWYSYVVGMKVADRELEVLREKLTQSEQENSSLRQQQTGDRAALTQAQQKIDELRQLYEQARPTDDIRAMLDMIRTRLAEGIESRRLLFALRTVQNPHDCEAAMTRRVQVRTPRYRGPDSNTQLRLGDAALLMVSGSGGNNGVEEWFDREQPVRLQVQIPGSRDVDMVGKLPLDQAVVVHGFEYHLLLSAAATRGFVEVNSQRCDIR